MLPRRRAPFWFTLAIAVALGVGVRLLVAAGVPVFPANAGADRPLLGFWFFVILAAELIWKGVEVAGKITLIVLRWMVLNLYLIVTRIGNGLMSTGHLLLQALKRGWDFTKLLYTDVLKPAWLKFWAWFDKARKWLDETFRPVLDWLKEVRDNFLAFYKTFVRPWLDLIDVTRKLLRVFAALHLAWAVKLDKKLGDLEALIDKPFRFVLAQLNQVINAVNRIMTADGLFQRVALIRSLSRDYLYAWRAIVQPYQTAPTSVNVDKLRKSLSANTLPVIAAGHRQYLRGDGGPDQALVSEMAAVLRIYFAKGELPTEL